MAEFKSDRQPMLQSSNPEAAHTYLQEKYLRAQECAMKTLADMAVTGLEAAVQQRLQDSTDKDGHANSGESMLFAPLD